MARVAKLLVGLILLYVLIMGGSGLVIRAMLSGETGEALRAKAQGLLPVEVGISGGDFNIAEWFFFRPSIGFNDLRVANPPGYSSEPLFEASRIAARAKLGSLLGDSIEIDEIEIVAPKLLVETDAKRRTNIQALLTALRSGKSETQAPESEPSGKTLAVRNFALTDGSIRYVSPGEEPLVVKNVNIRVVNFDPQSSFGLNAALDIFEEEAVHLSFEGSTGPFQPSSSPASGALSIEASLAKLPQKFREERLGNFVVSPGPDSRLSINADLEGDLLGVLAGTGKIVLEGVDLGKPDEKQLPLSGEAPVMLTLSDPVANPTFYVIMPDARLSLGSGTWQGGLEVQYDGEEIRGKSAGAVHGVNVNEMLTAFTDNKDKLFGSLELKRYDIAFRGADAEQIRNSLTGSGRLDLNDGWLAAFDTVKTIENHIKKALTGEAASEGVTKFVHFGTDFDVKDQHIYLPNLALEGDDLQLGGSGSYGIADGKLDFDLSSLIRGAMAAALGGAKDAEGVAQLAVPLKISGTMESPRVRPDISGMVKKAAIDQASRFINRLTGGDKPAAPEGQAEGEPEAAPEPTEAPRLPFGLGDILRKRTTDKQ